MQTNNKRLSILVIEDNEMFRSLSVEMLSGNNVISAENAAEGIEKFKANNPDIVFLDIGLPDKDGHYVLSEIMKVDKNAFVVMLTASSITTDVKGALENGAKGYIIKPFSRKQIKESLDDYFVHIKKIGG